MKKTVLAIIFVIASGHINSAFAYLRDGNSLLDDLQANKASALGYIEGVTDTGNNELFCIPPGTGSKQLKRVSYEFIKEHPEFIHHNAAYSVVKALETEWPCS